MSATPTEIIREARNVLFERGWCKNALEDESGRVCAVGALNVAATGSALWSGSLDVRRAMDALDAAVPDFNIVWFNNDIGRTFDELIDVFDRAEKIAERAESAPVQSPRAEALNG